MNRIYNNQYEYIKQLGVGGFGSVFLAKEKNSNRLVAIKQLNDLAARRQADIIHEMQMIGSFNHPHIVSYYHQFTEDGLLYLVMEYCKLGSLENAAALPGTTSEVIWGWAHTLTETMRFVHEKNIYHHDIKPGNILLTEYNHIKIADFGIANTGGGTRIYMAPECFYGQHNTNLDARVDVYALGLTLLELLTGNNPFRNKSMDEIEELHDTKDLGISALANWEQEIILKAIAKIPEQRFQTMQDFNEAIRARAVPVVFNKAIIQAGNFAEKAAHYLKLKKWAKAIHLLDYAEHSLTPSVNVLQVKAKYYLLLQKIDLAKQYYEKAMQKNPRLDVQKELGWINLELKNYPTAISLLSDHLHRNPQDFEAYNLLLQCFYQTGRYEAAMHLARTILSIDGDNHCFANNYFVAAATLQNGMLNDADEKVLANYKTTNPFLVYNRAVTTETEPTYDKKAGPTLQSKLLFMDYRFNDFKTSTLYCTNNNLETFKTGETQKAIITLGRDNYHVNDVRLPGGSAISRRHCVIVNCKDDVWLYDLNSTGTYVNTERVHHKVSLRGRKTITIGNTILETTTDKNKLI